MSYIDKEKLIENLVHDSPKDVVGYIATFPSEKYLPPKVSEWIPCELDFQGKSAKFICADCGQLITFPEPVKTCSHKFCLSCGAKMKNKQSRNEAVFNKKKT